MPALKRASGAVKRKVVQTFGRRSISLRLEKPIVSITFDDFPVSAWEVGGEILSRHQVRGSYYISTRLCGTTFDGNTIIGASDLGDVARAGHELGCHTAHHKRLSAVSADTMRAEFEDNEAQLRSIVPEYRMTTFAYPYGDLSLGAKDCASRRFAACRGVWAGVNSGTVDLGLLSCVCLEPHVLARRSVREWIAETVRLKGWLICLTHDVSRTPGPYGTTPDILEDLVTSALQAGCNVLPVKNALGLVAYSSTG